MTATRPRWRSSVLSGSESSISRDVDPVFRPHVDARDAIKSQLEDLAQMLRVYGEHIEGVAGTPPAGRGLSGAR